MGSCGVLFGPRGPGSPTRVAAVVPAWWRGVLSDDRYRASHTDDGAGAARLVLNGENGCGRQERYLLRVRREGVRLFTTTTRASGGGCRLQMRCGDWLFKRSGSSDPSHCSERC
jgi:hypothetical protein